MDTFLSLIGFTACIIITAFIIIKTIDAVWFFKEFRDKVTESLAIIEKTLRSLKP